jgi:hypothetical protein
MIQIPADLAKLYTSFMEQKGVETDQHRYYIKRKQAHHAVSLFYEDGPSFRQEDQERYILLTQIIPFSIWKRKIQLLVDCLV